jgi:hypothetical protein
MSMDVCGKKPTTEEGKRMATKRQVLAKYGNDRFLLLLFSPDQRQAILRRGAVPR